METPPPVPGGAAETLAAAEEKAKEKRARKRSRYLSSDYDTAILLDDDDDVTPTPRKGEEGAAPLLQLQEANVSTDDLLAALLRSAASPGDGSSTGPGVVDAGVLLRFFALHRASVLAAHCEDTTATTTDLHHTKDASVPAPAAAGPRLPNPCRPMVAIAADGSAGKKQDDAIAMGHAHAAHHIGPSNAAAPPEDGPNKMKKKVTFALDGCNADTADCSAQPAASSATGHAYGHHIGPANAAAEAEHKRGKQKMVAYASGVCNADAAAGSSAQPATGSANGTNSAPKRAKKKAKSSSGQGKHPEKPVALVLEFAKGGAIAPPSKEELLSTFRGFGSLIESESDITARRARLVFQSSAAAEAAYSCADALGTFSARRLQYLRPPPPAPKISLTDMRKNLEKMISSLTGPSSLGGEAAFDLAGQMLRLMAKVDKTLSAAGTPGPSTSAGAHRH
ncbi:unnamed protein product [Alopecurus aequalis]